MTGTAPTCRGLPRVSHLSHQGLGSSAPTRQEPQRPRLHRFADRADREQGLKTVSTARSFERFKFRLWRRLLPTEELVLLVASALSPRRSPAATARLSKPRGPLPACRFRRSLSPFVGAASTYLPALMAPEAESFKIYCWSPIAKLVAPWMSARADDRKSNEDGAVCHRDTRERPA